MTERQAEYNVTVISDGRIQQIIRELELAKEKGVPFTIIGMDEQAELDAIAELGEAQWKRCAAKLHEYRLLNEALPSEYRQTVKQLEIEVAGHRWRANSVRAYYGIWRGVCDEDAGLFDEFPQFKWSHWREIVMHAHGHDTKVSDVAIRWARTADEHGGMVIWPDALNAELHAPRDDRPPFIRDIERAANNLARAQKHCGDGYQRHVEAVRTIAAMIDDLQKELAK
jgi:hypothetical protein